MADGDISSEGEASSLAGVNNRWPAGDPNEAEIRAELARKAELIPLSTTTIRRGDLERLDRAVSFFLAIVEFADTELYDDMWNLRNDLVPFGPGDEHYDQENDDEREADAHE